jgi:hypothetical protein
MSPVVPIGNTYRQKEERKMELFISDYVFLVLALVGLCLVALL